MSKLMRGVKNVTKGYSSVQVKVREATSNDPWGPTGTQMSEIAQLSYNSSTEFYEIMDMLDKRLNDKGKNWRHVLKALKVLDYCLHEGSELVVTWAKQNLYIIKTLREFMYVDEEGRDVGQNIRVAAKELTSLLLDEERLRAERTDRKSWKSRVTGLEEYGPQQPHEPPRRRERRQFTEEEDAEYKLALEASKYQEEEDRRRREGRPPTDIDEDDLAKAIKLSKEEEEARRRALEEQNAQSLFDDTPVQTQPQPTGWNQGYQQGSGVDFFGNPIDQSQMQAQPTGYMQNAYTGFQAQPTGYQNGYSNGFNHPQPTGYDAFGQQNLQPQPTQAFQPQPTGYNPYAQQQPQPQQSEASLQPGSNNPWATGSQSTGLSSMAPLKTGSNNPFAQQSSFNRSQPSKMPSMSVLGSLPEQKTLSSFNQPSFSQPQTTLTPPPTQPQQPSKPMSEHEARLNALLASGEGQDTFGNVGDLRIPAQHTAPGTFVNSAGSGASKLTAEATGNNPFLRQQFTGMPTVSYGATGPAGMNGGFGGQSSSNPFGSRPQQQQANQGDLIQF